MFIAKNGAKDMHIPTCCDMRKLSECKRAAMLKASSLQNPKLENVGNKPEFGANMPKDKFSAFLGCFQDNSSARNPTRKCILFHKSEACLCSECEPLDPTDKGAIAILSSPSITTWILQPLDPAFLQAS